MSDHCNHLPDNSRDHNVKVFMLGAVFMLIIVIALSVMSADVAQSNHLLKQNKVNCDNPAELLSAQGRSCKGIGT